MQHRIIIFADFHVYNINKCCLLYKVYQRFYLIIRLYQWYCNTWIIFHHLLLQYITYTIITTLKMNFCCFQKKEYFLNWYVFTEWHWNEGVIMREWDGRYIWNIWAASRLNWPTNQVQTVGVHTFEQLRSMKVDTMTINSLNNKA